MGKVPSSCPAPVLPAGPITTQRLHGLYLRSLFLESCMVSWGAARTPHFQGGGIPFPWGTVLAAAGMVAAGRKQSQRSQMFPQIFFNLIKRSGMRRLKNTLCCNMKRCETSFLFKNKFNCPHIILKQIQRLMMTWTMPKSMYS